MEFHNSCDKLKQVYSKEYKSLMRDLGYLLRWNVFSKDGHENISHPSHWTYDMTSPPSTSRDLSKPLFPKEKSNKDKFTSSHF